MKKIFKVLWGILITFAFICSFNAASNKTTLKDLKDKLAKDKATYNTVVDKQNKIKKDMQSIESDLAKISKDIDDYELSIKESKDKVVELEGNIKEKQSEIDTLLNFLQVADQDNVYLEYVFNAKSFADFIYRSSVVEQLTKHNDELIDEMSALIDENIEEQKKLQNKIDESEQTIDKLNDTLKKYNVTMEDLVEDHKDAKADYEASKKEVEAYEKIYKQNGCSETTSILDCVDVPYADGFIRPLVSGTITSEYGLRYHPTLHYYRLHNGIDIGVAMNTNVYAAAAGVVSKVVRVSKPNVKNSSCGGNMVYVKHRINGKEYTSVYMHLHSISVKEQDFVTTSSVIGKSGGGESYDRCTTGPHLHFGIMKGDSYENPRNYVNFPALGKKFTSRW